MIIALTRVKTWSNKKKFLFITLFTLIFWGIYKFLALDTDIGIWLDRLNNPLFAVLALMVLPAIFLPRSRWYKGFLLFPLASILMAVLEVIYQYQSVPEGELFAWFLMRPEFLIAGVTGFLVIAQYFLSLDLFRKVTRITMMLLLVFGGFAFRQNYMDYTEMLNRRGEPAQNVIALSDTTPVMVHDHRIIYIPGAPCRFTADGGYVQGCVMELFQRILHVDFGGAVGLLDSGQTYRFAVALAALLSILLFFYVSGRWFCGWICPLSTLGDILDRLRNYLGLPHMKPVKPVNLTFFYSGLSFAAFTLALAKLIPYANEKGQVFGCAIPSYPFCKICPGQQVCPVASQGLDAYPPLPGTEWLFGFFRYSAILLLLLFLTAFVTSRRLWCRFCPMGMVGGLFNRGGLITLKKDSQKCNGCGVCNEVCPMDIHNVQQEMEKEDVSSFDCVYCLRCVDHCPQDKCLQLEFAGQRIIESQMVKNG
jgi:NAD-dependent dihydropyrimidine dehydrogenase PreA subunit